MRDALTGALYRRYMDAALPAAEATALRTQRPLTTLLIDLDHFKPTYGHLIGDIVLKRVSSVIIESSRAGDIVVRYGGEEFLALRRKRASMLQKCLASECGSASSWKQSSCPTADRLMLRQVSGSRRFRLITIETTCFVELMMLCTLQSPMEEIKFASLDFALGGQARLIQIFRVSQVSGRTAIHSEAKVGVLRRILATAMTAPGQQRSKLSSNLTRFPYGIRCEVIGRLYSITSALRQEQTLAHSFGSTCQRAKTTTGIANRGMAGFDRPSLAHYPSECKRASTRPASSTMSRTTSPAGRISLIAPPTWPA